VKKKKREGDTLSLPFFSSSHEGTKREQLHEKKGRGGEEMMIECPSLSAMPGEVRGREEKKGSASYTSVCREKRVLRKRRKKEVLPF